MPTTPSQDIHHGWYIDYNRSLGRQTQWLCSKSSATLWTNLMGIVVTIALARVFRLLLLLRAREPTAGPSSATTVRTTPEGIAFHTFSEYLQARREAAREGRIRLAGAEAPNVHQDIEPLWRTVVKILPLLMTYAGFLACGVVTANLATDSKALSTNLGCGLYVPASNSSKSQDALGPFAFQAQLDSAHLADSCYHSTGGADGCNFFVQQSIPYTPSDGPCPFVDGMCHENMSSAAQFSTGPTDAATLGIHAPQTFQFQRNTTCMPLNGNETYISTSAKDGIYTHTYNYGSGNGLPFTWQMKSRDNNLEWRAHYLVDTVMSGPAYDPILGLRPPKGSSLTLMFIHPQKISYLAPSDDPIFPAYTKFYIDSSDEPRWRYTGPHASVLACLDTTLWRDPGRFTDWKLYPPEPTFTIRDAHARGGFLLMVYALLWSNIYDTINYRLGGGLAAQKLVRGWESLPLATEQWKVEAKQLFETSLARIQIDARNIAQGAATSYPGLQKLEGDPAVCDNTFLFMSQGWQNVNVTGTIWICVAAITFIGLAVPIPAHDRLLIQFLPKFVTQTVPNFFTNIIPKFFTTTIPDIFSNIGTQCWKNIVRAVQRLVDEGGNIWTDFRSRRSR